MNDIRGLAPEGLHIPTKIEWNSLVWEPGGEEDATGPLEKGPFAAKITGIKTANGDDSKVGTAGQWWSADE